MHKERFKLISAVHLFLIRDGKILLLRRFNTGYEDGNYSVPAGHLDGNEKVIDAMIREAKEEALIEISPKDLKLAHVMHRKCEDERIDWFLVSEKWSGKIKIGEEDKCDDLRWFSVSSLPNNVIPYIKFAIKNFENKNYFSEYGWD